MWNPQLLQDACRSDIPYVILNITAQRMSFRVGLESTAVCGNSHRNSYQALTRPRAPHPSTRSAAGTTQVAAAATWKPRFAKDLVKILLMTTQYFQGKQYHSRFMFQQCYAARKAHIFRCIIHKELNNIQKSLHN